MSKHQQKVAVVTGASSGIGLVAAKTLAEQGWKIIAVGRNAQRLQAAEKTLHAAANADQIHMIQADLALMSDAARVADEVLQLTDSVHLLINNAGGMAAKKVITAEGYEESFAANHLGPFLLTQRLLPLLKKAAASAPKGSVRIVNTSSDGGEMIPAINLDDLHTFENYSNGLAYCSAKLGNVLFARGLASRLERDGIVAHAFHPGTVGSNFFSHTDDSVRERYGNMEMLTPEQGADTLLWLATAEAPGKSNGGYFSERKPRKPHPLVDDADFVERFWAVSEELVAKAGV